MKTISKNSVKALSFGISFLAIYLLVVWGLVSVNFKGLSLYEHLRGKKFQIGEFGFGLERFRELATVGLDGIDVLVMGTSHAYLGYDPREFKGKSLYNLGSTGQTPLHSYYLLKDRLKQYQPEILIYDVYFAAMASMPLIATEYLTYNRPLDLASVMMAIQSRDIWSIHTLLAAFVLNQKRPLGGLRQLAQQDKSYVSGGFIETFATSTGGDRSSEEIQFPEYQWGFLEKLINLCQQRNIKLVFTQHPMPKKTIEAFTNFEDVYLRMRSLASSYEVPYYEFNKDYPLSLDPQNDYIDNNHLNTNGARKYNKKLISLLQRDALLN